MPVLTVRAVGFHAEFASGATRPCVFSCEDPDGGDTGEFVVKFRSTIRGAATGLYFEYVGNLLASRLGLHVPEPAIVILEPQLADATPNEAVAAAIRASAGENFGSRHLEGLPTCPGNWAIPADLKGGALEVFAFDALIDNVDRRLEKPNMLIGKNEIFVIDHELAFAFTRLIGGGARFDTHILDGTMRNHPLYRGLQGGQTDLGGFMAALGSISHAELDELMESAPPGFSREYRDKIVARIHEVQEQPDLFVACIERVINGH